MFTPSPVNKKTSRNSSPKVPHNTAYKSLGKPSPFSSLHVSKTAKIKHESKVIQEEILALSASFLSEYRKKHHQKDLARTKEVNKTKLEGNRQKLVKIIEEREIRKGINESLLTQEMRKIIKRFPDLGHIVWPGRMPQPIVGSGSASPKRNTNLLYSKSFTPEVSDHKQATPIIGTRPVRSRNLKTESYEIVIKLKLDENLRGISPVLSNSREKEGDSVRDSEFLEWEESMEGEHEIKLGIQPIGKGIHNMQITGTVVRKTTPITLMPKAPSDPSSPTHK